MISAGIIAEYNPFHKGHAYHIEKTRQITGADCIIVIMSGNFVQRGEPAIVDKYTRAECAIEGGADLVIELPCIHALSSAEQFAAGAVNILSAMDTDYLSFGSETGELGPLFEIATILADEPSEFKQVLSHELSLGVSFPVARLKALQTILPSATEYIDTPNNILAIEYLKEIIKNHHNISPITIFRKGHGYHDVNISNNTQEHLSNSAGENFVSATALRKIFENTSGFDLKSLQTGLSSTSVDILLKHHKLTFPIFADDFSSLLTYKISLLIYNGADFTLYSDISEALANKITKANLGNSRNSRNSASLTNLTVSQLATQLKTRDMTYSRIMRSLMHILLEHKKDYTPQNYIRILGFNQNGREYLSSIKKKCTVPIVTKPADYKDLLKSDVFASDIYNQIIFQKYGTTIKNDYMHELIIKGTSSNK